MRNHDNYRFLTVVAAAFFLPVAVGRFFFSADAGVDTDTAATFSTALRVAGAATPALSSSAASPERMSVTATVSADSAMLGDRLSLDIAITGIPKGARVIPPETDKGFGEFSVLSMEDAPEQKGAKARGGNRDSSTYRYRYGIAAYKPQNCTIPSIRFLVGTGTGAGIGAVGIDDGGRVDTLATQPIPIKILSALPAAPPDSGGFAIKDLKGQQRAGKATLWYLWVILSVVVAAAVFILIRGRFKKPVAVAPAVPLLPPYEEAIEAIKVLEGKKYLERGMAREYVFELSELFKRYIGRRYDTIAPELTTEEIVDWLEFSGISREMRLCAERFFRSGDQVKFAKLLPDRERADGYMKDVRTFIEATKPDSELPYERQTERMGVVAQ